MYIVIVSLVFFVVRRRQCRRRPLRPVLPARQPYLSFFALYINTFASNSLCVNKHSLNLRRRHRLQFRRRPCKSCRCGSIWLLLSRYFSIYSPPTPVPPTPVYATSTITTTISHQLTSTCCSSPPTPVPPTPVPPTPVPPTPVPPTPVPPAPPGSTNAPTVRSLCLFDIYTIVCNLVVVVVVSPSRHQRRRRQHRRPRRPPSLRLRRRHRPAPPRHRHQAAQPRPKRQQ
jgi:hypothetical protein